MFDGWFTTQYRIKRIATLQYSGKYKYIFKLQHRHFLLPFWILDYVDSDEKNTIEEMKTRSFEARQKGIVSYCYNADPVPEYIPEEQVQKYLLEREKKEGK